MRRLGSPLYDSQAAGRGSQTLLTAHIQLRMQAGRAGTECGAITRTYLTWTVFRHLEPNKLEARPRFCQTERKTCCLHFQKLLAVSESQDKLSCALVPDQP